MRGTLVAPSNRVGTGTMRPPAPPPEEGGLPLGGDRFRRQTWGDEEKGGGLVNRATRSVLVDGAEFPLSDHPFVFGRASLDGVVGLDPNDMGISAVAGSVEHAAGLWWVVNRSRKRRLLLELSPGTPPVQLGCGQRFAVSVPRVAVL